MLVQNNSVGSKNANASLVTHRLTKPQLFWNLLPAQLVEQTILMQQGELTDTGALAILTGEFTGRCPEDRFIVKDATTEKTVNWGKVNIAFDPEKYEKLYEKLTAHLNSEAQLFVQEAKVCADAQYSLKVRLITNQPAQALFANNMFMRLTTTEIENFEPDWEILAASNFKAIPEIDGTRNPNFVVVNFTKKIVIIGGTGYTGEIKKSVFSILNYLLPLHHQVLSMHCSANVGKNNDTALFFGLSGTGKTTLSADPNRALIGDDEHGWSANTVFNFEGGCYAKCIKLSKETEPQIFDAIRFGALLENITFEPNTRTPNYNDSSITENTRVSYPLEHIPNTQPNSIGSIPQNIFFLTCDAFGVLPPISKLTEAQAMYHFISGYTAKVAGTEKGITDPKTTFSSCFGSPFLPLHPTQYAEMLGKKIAETQPNVWLINTGWTGGGVGVGTRMKLAYTRATITAALQGDLNNVPFETDPIFGLAMPTQCPNVPTNILNPRNTWKNPAEYDKQATKLAEKFIDNFKQFEAHANDTIKSASPKLPSLA